MRLIDADKLTDEIKTRCRLYCKHPKIYCENVCKIGTILDDIDEAQTIKVSGLRLYSLEDMQKQYQDGLEKGLTEQERRGIWLEDELGIIICSVCKRPRRDNREVHTKYCNACGARLREEV